MYESTYNLQIKSTRGSKSATEELRKRRELIKSTGLIGHYIVTSAH